jgi:hypothetical protein
MIAYDYARPRRGLRRSRRSLQRDPLVVVAALACAILFLVILARAAYGGTAVDGQSIVVQPGQTVWSIASERYPGDDVRTRVDQIVTANHLQGAQVFAGETLMLPAP